MKPYVIARRAGKSELAHLSTRSVSTRKGNAQIGRVGKWEDSDRWWYFCHHRHNQPGVYRTRREAVEALWATHEGE